MAEPNVKSNVLEDIEKKSENLIQSNDELSARIRQNQSTLASMNKELESLKSGLGEGFDPAAKVRLEEIKRELLAKRELLSELIDSVKPIEVDVGRNENLIETLHQKINDQGDKIAELSRDILNHRKEMHHLTDLNKILKERLVEKESTANILKDKLKEKTDLLTAVDDKNRQMEQEVDSAKKKMFAMENKLGAVEKRIYAGDERNQQILYSLMQSKARIKEFEEALAKRDQLLEEKEAEFNDVLEQTRVEGVEKRKLIMEAHAKKVAVLNAQIASLSSALEQQKSIVKSRVSKEKALIRDFNDRMREILSDRSVAFVPEVSPDDAEMNKTSLIDEAYTEDNAQVNSADGIVSPSKEDHDVMSSRIDEILPMVEVALQHGDSAEKITNSLLSSGYSEKEVHTALDHIQANQ